MHAVAVIANIHIYAYSNSVLAATAIANTTCSQQLVLNKIYIPL